MDLLNNVQNSIRKISHENGIGGCEQCPSLHSRRRKSMTAYVQYNEDENPNRDLFLCDECYQEYFQYWDEKWKEYYSNRY